MYPKGAMAQQLTPEQWQEKLASMSPEEIKELQKQQCPFCQIAAGKIPARKIYEDDKVLAVLDINPAASGHTLLMPKEHYAIMPMVPEETLAHLGKIAKHIAKAFQKRLFAKGTNMFIANGAAAGQQVQHFLLHLIPREDGDGIEIFQLSEGSVSPEFEKAKQTLSQNLYAVMREYVKKYPTGKKIPDVPKPTEEQLLQLVEQNQQLKELITKQPEQFKQLAKTHSQLSVLFGGVDLDAFIAKVQGKKERTEDTVDLDAIGDLLEKDISLPSPPKEHSPPQPPRSSPELAPETKKENDKQKQKKTRKEDNVDLDKVLDLLGGE